jgi:hypothetical protein
MKGVVTCEEIRNYYKAGTGKSLRISPGVTGRDLLTGQL